jgi:hypothetical protein
MGKIGDDVGNFLHFSFWNMGEYFVITAQRKEELFQGVM